MAAKRFSVQRRADDARSKTGRARWTPGCDPRPLADLSMIFLWRPGTLHRQPSLPPQGPPDGRASKLLSFRLGRVAHYYHRAVRERRSVFRLRWSRSITPVPSAAAAMASSEWVPAWLP